ncbi:MAG: glycerophosphodiester phosphodiesterase [Pseudomonadota bacterium]|nr:glycerophosphodiester phosphodiesterase [Pseudomonadota bacterium]
MRPEPVSGDAAEAFGLLQNPPVAHRGLWEPKGAPENSLAAFEAAVDAGYGVELDVRLSADGEVMVFHDAGLERMVGRQGRLADHTATELSTMRLRGGREPVPTLRQVFDIIDGRCLIHVELKTTPGEEGPLDAAVAALLDNYAGPVCIIGFNAQSHAWWAANRPKVLRGLDSYSYDDEAALRLPAEMRRSLQALEQVARARPHFLALSTNMLTSSPARAARAAGFLIVAWTVRSAEQAAEVAPHCDNIIFEGFRA